MKGGESVWLKVRIRALIKPFEFSKTKEGKRYEYV